MALVRWTPRKSILDLYNEVNRLFDSFFAPTEEEEETFATRFYPAVDIEEKDKEYYVTVELPGVKKNDVKVAVKDNLLMISGEKKSEKEEKGKNYHRSERVFGSFQRTFRLPELVDQDNISAEYKDGVLHITIPKKEEAVSKEIEIKVK
ncbi:MAG: Hsp20/alpha crystallin family protein [Candidatus Marinimicrobia bacterium]|nr:Hsp20/alpha crystallin family protein [Candidatus Neomarinimicrobiota bacterium]